MPKSSQFMMSLGQKKKNSTIFIYQIVISQQLNRHWKNSILYHSSTAVYLLLKNQAQVCKS